MFAEKDLRFELVPKSENSTESEHRNVFSIIFDEFFFLKSLWQNNKTIWRASFPLHLSIYFSSFSIILMLLMNFIFYLSNEQLIFYVVPFLSGVITVNTIFSSIVGVFSIVFLIYIKTKTKTINGSGFISLLVLLIYFASLFGWLILDAHFVPNFTSVFFYLLSNREIPALNIFSKIHILTFVIFIMRIPFSRLSHFIYYFFKFKKVEIDRFNELSDLNLYKILTIENNLKIKWVSPHINNNGQNTWVGILDKNDK